MKFTCKLYCSLILLLGFVTTANAQLYKIDLDKKIAKASLIVEGRVMERYSFWNDAHTVIYTANKVHVYKLFKGRVIEKDVEVITLGGTVGTKCLKVSDVLQLDVNDAGIFFLQENALKLQSPLTKRTLFDVYSSGQGFLKYDKAARKAYAPFVHYENIAQTLYNLITRQTGTATIIDDNFKVGANGIVSNGTAAVAITSFTPATVTAGAMNDSRNILTINGSGFGNNPGSLASVAFKDANSDNTDPDYTIDYNSPYIISWTDTKIVLHVPDRAATGKIMVTGDDGTAATSATDIQVLFSVIDAEFNGANNTTIIKEPRLMNTNGNGGYSVQYSTSTMGKGIDFSISPAKETFLRALATWKEITGANIIEGGNTIQQEVKDDDVNLVVFDNENTGQPHMGDGVLESTYSWFSACNDVNGNILTAQKTGFDIILRNDKVSLGSNVSFEDGPCFPASGTYDLEMIILHELGHALNLSHINDDYENGGGGYQTVNPSKLMHYAILDYVGRRSPDVSAYQGALYNITPQHATYGNCGLYAREMTPLTATTATFDDCPSTFPSTPLQDNTTVIFDLVHATSNKFVDPSFKQVTCNNNGTSVTNNVFYAFSTGSKTEVKLDISNYTTVPETLSSCSGQGVRMALYDVQTCPQGQSYPTPSICVNFSGNGSIDVKGLEQNHKYLMYFDGIRNTKAFFNVVFNSNGSTPGTTTTVDIYPNPVVNGKFNIRINNTTGSFYEYALFDAVGKLVSTGKLSVTLPIQTSAINIQNVASGVYFLRLTDEKGKTITETKVVKYN